MPVSYDEHIRPLFRENDHQSMRFAFDLWSYQDVSANATAIFEKLSAGAMPCDAAWPSERVELFRQWMDTGMRETASDPVPAAAALAEPSGASTASVEAIEGRLRRVLDLRSEQHVRRTCHRHRAPRAAHLHALCSGRARARPHVRVPVRGLHAETLHRRRAHARSSSVRSSAGARHALDGRQAGDAPSGHQLQPRQLPRRQPASVPAEPAPTGQALPERRPARPCCRSASRRCATSSTSSDPRAWTSTTPKGSPPWNSASRSWASRRSRPTCKSSRPSAISTGRSKRAFATWPRRWARTSFSSARVRSKSAATYSVGQQLRPITCVDDAVQAIETIVEQGEGPRGDWRNAHFGRFLEVLDEFLADAGGEPGPGGRPPGPAGARATPRGRRGRRSDHRPTDGGRRRPRQRRLRGAPAASLPAP